MAAEKKETILALLGGGPEKPAADKGKMEDDSMPDMGEDKEVPMDKGVDDDGEEQIAADEVMEALESKDSAALKDALASFIKICMAKY